MHGMTIDFPCRIGERVTVDGQTWTISGLMIGVGGIKTMMLDGSQGRRIVRDVAILGDRPGRRVNPTIQYLRQALRADRQIDALIERAERYKDLAAKATSRMTATRTSGTSQRSAVEDNVCKLVDLSRDLLAEADQMAETVREIEVLIARVPDERYRDLLRWRYLNGWRWERIAEALDLTNVRWVYEMHGRALTEVEKYLGLH